MLARAGHRSGDDQLAHYAEVLQASTEFQVSSSDEFYSWAGLQAGLLLGEPEQASIEQFTQATGRREADRVRLGGLVAPDAEFEELWQRIDDDDLRDTYRETLKEAIRGDSTTMEDLPGVQQQLFVQQAQNEQVQSQVDGLIDLASENLDDEAARLVADTNQDRRGTFLLMAATIGLMAIGVAGHAMLVARPLRR